MHTNLKVKKEGYCFCFILLKDGHDISDIAHFEYEELQVFQT